MWQLLLRLKLWEEIKDNRKAGLEKTVGYLQEKLVFKLLEETVYIEKETLDIKS